MYQLYILTFHLIIILLIHILHRKCIVCLCKRNSGSQLPNSTLHQHSNLVATRFCLEINSKIYIFDILMTAFAFIDYYHGYNFLVMYLSHPLSINLFFSYSSFTYFLSLSLFYVHFPIPDCMDYDILELLAFPWKETQ